MNAEVLETVDTLKYLKRGVELVKTMNDFLASHKESEEINWYKVAVIKGATFGEYYKMWLEGSHLIANHVLLEEGLPQRISPRQDAFLTSFDKEHSLL